MANLRDMDDLAMYFGEPYVINDKIIIKQPKIKDIVAYGEGAYFSIAHTLTAISSD